MTVSDFSSSNSTSSGDPFHAAMCSGVTASAFLGQITLRYMNLLIFVYAYTSLKVTRVCETISVTARNHK